MSENTFWAICIESSSVQAAIWKIDGGNASIVSIAPLAKWEDPKELVDAVDTTLSAGIQNLPEEGDKNIKEPSQVVFGVPPSWVEDGSIKKEFLEKIKEICIKLSLEPTGFVVLPEAIANFVKSEEGAPLTGIIIGLSSNVIDISVFKLGNLVGTVNVSRSVNLYEDVIEGLARFSEKESFPSRFILYNASDIELDEGRQALLSYDWTDGKDGIKFLHTPKIEILSPEKKVIAIALGGALEMAQVQKIQFKDKEKEEESELQEVPKTLDNSQKLASLGFAIGSHVDTKEKPIVERKDIKPLTILSKVLSRGTKTLTKINIMKKLSLGNKKNKLYFVILSVIILLIVGLIGIYTLPKIEITVFVSPQKLEKNEIVIVNDNGENKLEEAIVGGKLVNVEVGGEKSKTATGQKTVGEKAKGEVTIRNGTSVNLKLDTKTILISSANLKFNLLEVASVSGALSPASPGTAQVKVQAEAIGSEYNLAKGETFKVGNYPKSDVDAVAETDFTGGSSKDIVAVSKEDIKSLEDDIKVELKEEGVAKIRENLKENELLIFESAELIIKSKNFSNAVGDEAKSVKITMEAEVSVLVVDKSIFVNLAKEFLKDQVPDGYVLRDNQIDFAFDENVQKVGDVWEVNSIFKANLLPETKEDELKKLISGKNINAINELFREKVGGYKSSEVVLKNYIPKLMNFVPHNVENITLIISAEKN